jgi:hypothetical protein
MPDDSLCLYHDGSGQRIPGPRNPDRRPDDQQLDQLPQQRLPLVAAGGRALAFGAAPPRPLAACRLPASRASAMVRR